MNPNIDLYDAQQALSFLVQQLAYIEPQVYATRYPTIQYPFLIPVDTSAPEWVKTITFYSVDGVGKAQWINHYGKDIPYANDVRSQFNTPVNMAGIGYEYTLEEINQARMIPGMNLTADRAGYARQAYEEFVDGVMMRGDTDVGYNGLINYPGITTVPAPVGVSTFADWPRKTPDEILADINSLLAGIYTGTNTVEWANTVLLPIDRLLYISNLRLTDLSETTVLTYVLRNNAYTAVTGQALTFRGVRGLENAGAGATHRMIAYRRAPDVLKAHIPMPHRFLTPQQIILIFKVPGIFRLGGLDIRLPGAVRYMDGI